MPSYKVQSDGTLFNAVTLTTAYTGNTKTIAVAGAEEAILFVNYTTGSGETSNSIEIKVEFGPTDTDVYQDVNEAVSSGTSTLYQKEYTFVGASAATSYKFRLPIPVADKFMKVSIKESGVSTNAGTATVKTTFSGI